MFSYRKSVLFQLIFGVQIKSTLKIQNKMYNILIVLASCSKSMEQPLLSAVTLMMILVTARSVESNTSFHPQLNTEP